MASILSAVALFFGVGYKAQAADVEFYNTHAGSSGFCCVTNNEGDYYFEKFTATTSNISKITLYAYGENNSGAYLKIYDYIMGQLIYSDLTDVSFPSPNTSVTWTIPDLPLQLGRTYEIRFYNIQAPRYDTDGPAFAIAMGHHNAAGNDYYNTAIWIDAIMYYEDNFTAADPSGAIISPISGIVIDAPDMPYFQGTSTAAYMIVSWATASGSPKSSGYSHIERGIDPAAVFTWSYFDNLPAGDYINYVDLIGSSSITTLTRDFTVNSAVVYDPIPELSPSVCLSWAAEACTDATSTFFGGVYCGLKSAAVWAACPTKFSTDLLNNQWQEMRASFPFTAFFQITDSVEAAIASTSTSTDHTLGLPMIRKTATGTQWYVLPAVSSSTLPAMVGGSTNAGLIRDTFRWLAWIGVAGLIVWQIKSKKNDS